MKTATAIVMGAVNEANLQPGEVLPVEIDGAYDEQEVQRLLNGLQSNDKFFTAQFEENCVIVTCEGRDDHD